MTNRPYLAFVQSSGKPPELVKLLNWGEVKNFVNLNRGNCVIAYNVISEVETHFDEEGELVLTK